MSPSPDPSASHLARTSAALTSALPDLEHLIAAAEEAAPRLAAGGRLWLSGAPGPVSEFLGRAGGLMAARRLGKEPPGPGDVVLHFPTGPEDPPREFAGPALVVRFTATPAPATPTTFACAGRGVSPTLGMVILGWLFTGELIAALTRQGRMPVIFLSIGMYEGFGRMEKYRHGEVAFHGDLTVPPVAPGTIARQYLELVGGMLRRLEQQRASLDVAGDWARQAVADHRRLFLYTMGHGVPPEVSDSAIGQLFRTSQWLAGFLRPPRPADAFAAGDFAAHVGYQHPPEDLFRRARSVGARVAYVSVRSDRAVAADPGIVWIDPQWDWPDACVPLPGYDVPILPASGIVNAALAWELYRLATRA